MEPPLGRVYQSQVDPPKPASRQVQIVIFVGFGFFCFFLIAAIVISVVSARRARLQDAESLRAIGGVRFTLSKSAKRVDKREREEAFKREKQRSLEREKILDEELLRVGEAVRKPQPAVARKQHKSEPVKATTTKKISEMSVRTPRKSSLPSAQAQVQVKRKKSASREKERIRVEAERKDKERAVKGSNETKKAVDKPVRRK